MSHIKISSRNKSESNNNNDNSNISYLIKKVIELENKSVENIDTLDKKSLELQEKINKVDELAKINLNESKEFLANKIDSLENKISEKTISETIIEKLEITEKGLGSNVVIGADGKLKELTSSIRFKENVKFIDNYKNIYKLNGRKYNYLGEHPEEDISYGFLAEEVALVDKSLVIYKDDVPYSLQYNEFIPLLVECVKDHNEQILLLEEENAKREQKMSDLNNNFNEKLDKLANVIENLDKKVEEHHKKKKKSDISFISIMVYIVFFLQLIQFAMIWK